MCVVQDCVVGSVSRKYGAQFQDGNSDDRSQHTDLRLWTTI